MRIENKDEEEEAAEKTALTRLRALSSRVLRREFVQHSCAAYEFTVKCCARGTTHSGGNMPNERRIE